VLLNLDETSYKGGTMGKNHPIAWYQEFNGGRMFYSAGGHTDESYIEPLFVKHILRGIEYAAGSQKLDYTKVNLPSKDFFKVENIATGLKDPMEIAVTPDGRIFILERQAALRMFDPITKETTLIKQLDAMCSERKKEEGDNDSGGLGITLDPDFAKNGFVHIYYSRFDKEVHRLARFSFKNNKLEDEKMILEIPYFLGAHASHQGGSLAFGKDRMLFLAAGDNTTPHSSSGYTPIDEGKGRKWHDAQRTTANSNDLRGGITRIIINRDGTYTIPKGNLYPEGIKNTRPELFIKGCRNPYRISVDQKSGFLYWGDVGPDARDGDETRGPQGFDTFNQARNAGFYGWPYFRGNKHAYIDYDFKTGKTGVAFDEAGATNNSPNNTGLNKLPPVEGAMIWYPYGDTGDFPELGSGGRTAMAGPVYHQNKQLKENFPDYFDDVVIFYEWMRGYIKLVKLGKNGELQAIRPFLSGQSLTHPTDMELGPEGELYILEYGSKWFGSTDGTLKRVTFRGYNPSPEVTASVSTLAGAAPLKTKLSASAEDHEDGTNLTYEWQIDGQKITPPTAEYTFTKPGIHTVILKVTDQGDATTTQQWSVAVGNAAPDVNISLKGNPTTFTWGQTLEYLLDIKDAEDQSIDPERIRVEAEYHPSGTLLGQAVDLDPRLNGILTTHPGSKMLVTNSCVACHLAESQSIGPALKDVAFKYAGIKDGASYLINKIQKGGTGVRGHALMPPNAHIPQENIASMVDAIFTLKKDANMLSLGKDGKLALAERPKVTDNTKGIYAIKAAYTDAGANGLPTLTAWSKPILLHVSEQGIPVAPKDRTTLGHQQCTINENSARAIDAPYHCIGFYTQADTSLSWTIDVKEAGEYTCSTTLANPIGGGSTFQILCESQVLSGTVPNTADWGRFKESSHGVIKLTQGTHTLTFKPTLLAGSALENVKNLVLERK